MWNLGEFRELERKVLESINSGFPLNEGLKKLMIFYFYNMELEKLRKILKTYIEFFGEKEREIRWLKFMLRFMAMEPLNEPEDPVPAFYYHLYYRGDVKRALEILENNRDFIRSISREFMHSLYTQVFNLMGRMYVIPDEILKELRGPMRAYLNVNRAIGGDILAAFKIFRSGGFKFVISHPFSKRLAIIGRMITALIEGDGLTYEVMLRNFDRDGERYLHTVGRILGSVFDPSLGVKEEEIPEYITFLRTLNSFVRKGCGECGCPEHYRGVESFLWHMRKIKERRVYLSFGGRVRLLRGTEEVHVPRRKALIILAILRSAGMEELKGMAHYIFPSSPHPMKTVYDYMRFIREYRFAPTNLRFTLHSGTFLYDEDEPWAIALKDLLRRRGKLNPPLIARP